jgi:hypothetical protein
MNLKGKSLDSLPHPKAMNLKGIFFGSNPMNLKGKYTVCPTAND